ncbi:MAG: HEAT repeat domain-containing protein [Bacteroidales bacterium]
MSISLSKVLQIKTEEQKPVLLLVLYGFFMGASIAFFYTAAISLFLHNFQRGMLPYVYIAGGLVIYLFGKAFRRYQQVLSISRILIYGIIFLLISSAIIIIGYEITANPWIAFVMFLWINVFLFIHTVGFNGMASRLFTLQQGKRLYGVIGVGEVFSNVLGFFSVPFILRIVKTEYMALITLITLAITLVVILLIVKTYRKQLTVRGSAKKTTAHPKKPFSDLFKNPYTLYLFILALLPVFGLYFVDYVFFGQTQIAFPQKEVLSGFIGIFFGVMAVVEFLIKTLVYGRLIEKFGVKPGLIALPVLLLFSTILASLSGTFFGIASMFSFVVLSKLFIRSVRNSINDPSYLILYQALPAEERFAFQGKIEAGPKAVSNIIVGAVLILLIELNLSLVFFNYIFIIVLIYWTWASFRINNLYREELKKILKEKGSKTEDIPVETNKDIYSRILEKKVAETGKLLSLQELANFAQSKDADNRELAAYQLSHSGRYQAVQLLSGLMKDPDVKVRQAAILSAGHIKSHEFWPILIENLLSDHYHTFAREALAGIGIPVLRDLDLLLKKMEGNPEMLIRILSLIGHIGGKEGIARLRVYMNHPVYEVRKKALLSLCDNRYIATASETQIIKRSVEDEINFIVWYIASIWDLKDLANSSNLINELQKQIDAKNQYIFNLLSLLFEPAMMNHIREHLRQGTPEAKIYALELFDMMVSGDIKGNLLPLLEDIPLHQVLNAYRETFPQENLDLNERLFDIINKDYSHVSSKVKAEAILLLSMYPSEEAKRVLFSCLSHPDEQIWQPACEVLMKIDEAEVQKKVRLFGKDKEKVFNRYIEKIKLELTTQNRQTLVI